MVKDEAAGIRSFELVSPNGDQLPPFTAGAHIDVHLGNNIVRQYSLSNAPSEREKFRIAVLLDANGRGGSLAMHKIKEGQLIEISGPRNHFALAGPETNLHLMLAGGIGVTPMMSMIPELEARGANYALHYCTRTPENTAFLSDLAARIESKAVRVHHDNGDPARGLDIEALVSNYVPGMHLYFCGPAGFMAEIKKHLGAWPPHEYGTTLAVSIYLATLASIAVISAIFLPDTYRRNYNSAEVVTDTKPAGVDVAIAPSPSLAR